LRNFPLFFSDDLGLLIIRVFMGYYIKAVKRDVVFEKSFGIR